MATSETPQTRDRGMKVCVGEAVCGSGATPPCLQPAVARLSVPLAANGQGTMRVLLVVSDMERARPREAGAERWPTFCGLRRFASSSKHNVNLRNVQDAKPRKPQNRWKAGTVYIFYIFYTSTRPIHHCRTMSSSFESGRKAAEEARSKPPSTLRAPPKASVFTYFRHSGVGRRHMI